MPAYTTLRSTHIIEGREPLSYEEVNYGKDLERTKVRQTKESRVQQEEYRLQDIARAKIKPITDPDEDKAERRKRGARRRRGGRLGTILTGETLG